MDMWLRAAVEALPAGWFGRLGHWRSRVRAILLGTLCSGCDLAPLLLCQLFLAIEVAGGPKQSVEHLFSCDCKPSALKWMQKCPFPPSRAHARCPRPHCVTM